MKPYFETDSGKLYQGDVLETLKYIDDGIVQCVVTSPPYWGLRDYGADGQLGLEATPDEYISKMVEIFREMKRVLRDDGTLWLNMGDCYAGSGRGRNADGTWNQGKGGTKQATNKGSTTGRTVNKKSLEIKKIEAGDIGNAWVKPPAGYKPKDLVGIPWRLAFALQADGWYLRSDIIWSKPNSMPESVTDRPTKAHEYLFLMAKSERYYYDAEAIKEDGRNKRSVWTIPTQPFPEAHFATFPTALVIPCIKAGTSEEGNCSVCGKPWVRIVEKTSMEVREGVKGRIDRTDCSGTMTKAPTAKTLGWQPSCSCNADTEKPIVLDPFMGSGTVAEVCERYGRHWIGIELSEEYCEIAAKRIEKEASQYKLEI